MHFRLCLCLLLLSGLSAVANEAGFCLQGAHNLPPADGHLNKGSRRLPPAQPVLSAYDWDVAHTANVQQASDGYKPCHAEAPVFRFRVVNGAIFVDHDHHSDARYKSYRMAFIEQLALAMWLYKDFPDVDLVVDFTDHPQLCDQDVPFLRYSIFNMSLLPTGQSYNTTELLAPAWVTQQYAARVHSWTRGFTIPSPEAWRDLSLTSAQLDDFTSCLDSTHPWANKQLKAFWRGQATGCSRGWPQLGTNSKNQAAGTQGPVHAAPHLLRNKRVQMVLQLFPYQPQLADVGITSLPQLTPECLGAGVTTAAHRQQQAAQQGSGRGHARRRRWRRRRVRPRRTVLGGLPGGTFEAQPLQSLLGRVAGLHEGTLGRRLEVWRPRQARTASTADESTSASVATTDAGDDQDAPAAAEGSAPGPAMPRARAYRGIAALLHKEGIGLEGWADAALTLSIDGYGPPFRLPQLLLLGSAVLRMASPYQTWLDWVLVPGRHLQEFAYDLTDLEQRVVQLLEPAAENSSTPRAGQGAHGAALHGMALAARALVAQKVELVAQLDAFAWSVARYKEVCPWQVQEPGANDSAWHVLQLGADVFQSKGVAEGVRLQVMRYLSKNFQSALQHPALKAAMHGSGG